MISYKLYHKRLEIRKIFFGREITNRIIIFESINKFESLCDNYFKYILLNEKILLKFDENFHIVLWNNIYKFCESDKPQIEILININRLYDSKDIK